MKLAFKKTRYWPLIALAALLLALMAQPALAITLYQWVGPNSNTNWNNPNNWSHPGPGVPISGSDVSLTSTTGNKTATLNTVAPSAPPPFNSVIIDAIGGGTFTLNQSSSSTSLSADSEVIGSSGKGVYNQSSGKNSATNETVGATGTGDGVYNQSGGTNTISQTLAVGVVSGSKGTYNRTGGTTSAGAMVLGNGGVGTFKQSSGTVTIGSVNPDTGQPFSLILGGEVLTSGTGTGTYNMSSGILTVGSGVVVGQTGTGIFTQSAGNTTINGELVVGNQTGSSGSFTMSSGTLKVTGDEIIGDHGVGTFKQSSGAHTIGGGLFVGNNPGSTGSSFTMSSGSLGIGGGLFVASEGSTASFTQTSGSVTAGGDFVLGRLPGTDGTYTMTSGSLLVKGSAGEYIGQNGTGTFNQTSGSNTASKNIFIAQGVGSVGTYNLNSGSVTSNFSPPFDATADIINYGAAFPGASGVGTFNVTGTATVTGDFLNFGNVKTTGADVTWNGNFVNHNVYTSDPSTQTFNNDFQNTTTGYVVATHTQDLFVVKGDFINNSTEIPLWNTADARLRFAKGGVGNDTIHNFYVAGQGAAPGYTITDFAWRLLNITNQTIYLKDGNAIPFGDQWLQVLTGATITAMAPGQSTTNIFNADTTTFFDLWYDKNLAANAYLGGFDYAIPGINGGQNGTDRKSVV